MKLYTLCQCVALPLGTYSTKWCLSLKKMYSVYSLWMIPHCLSVASKAPLRTRKGCMQLITSHDKTDHDGKTNVFLRNRGGLVIGPLLPSVNSSAISLNTAGTVVYMYCVYCTQVQWVLYTSVVSFVH